MDPGTGTLYYSSNHARAAGVEYPVELTGRQVDIERISQAVASTWNAEQKKIRKTKMKSARIARRNNR